MQTPVPDRPVGDREMAGRIRTYDWASTPLGPIASWPQSLKTAVDILHGSGHAMQLAWGPERTVLYNDAYAPARGPASRCARPSVPRGMAGYLGGDRAARQARVRGRDGAIRGPAAGHDSVRLPGGYLVEFLLLAWEG